MSLYVRVFCNFYTHRKTMRLKAAIGDAAYWVPPRLWSYAADNQPDGDFSGYSATEMAMLIGYQGDADGMLQALTSSGFLNSDLKIHDWAERNSYHQTFSDRAKRAADARWQKERTKEKGEEKTGKDMKGKETSIASSMLQASISLQNVLNQAYGRTEKQPWTYIEQQTLSEVARRPDVEKETAELMAYRARDQRWFPRSIVKLLTEWSTVLDQSRQAPINGNTNGHASTNGTKGPSVWTLREIIAAKQETVDNLRAENANESMGRYEWEEGTEKEKAQCKQLLKEIEAINKQIAGMKT